ncbi:uncharacterized protein LOC144536796 [Sander vitreus]
MPSPVISPPGSEPETCVTVFQHLAKCARRTEEAKAARLLADLWSSSPSCSSPEQSFEGTRLAIFSGNRGGRKRGRGRHGPRRPTLVQPLSSGPDPKLSSGPEPVLSSSSEPEVSSDLVSVLTSVTVPESTSFPECKLTIVPELTCSLPEPPQTPSRPESPMTALQESSSGPESLTTTLPECQSGPECQSLRRPASRPTSVPVTLSVDLPTSDPVALIPVTVPVTLSADPLTPVPVTLSADTGPSDPSPALLTRCLFPALLTGLQPTEGICFRCQPPEGFRTNRDISSFLFFFFKRDEEAKTYPPDGA